MDTWSDADQADAAGLVWRDRARCPNGHPLHQALDPSLTLVLNDDICLMCKAEEYRREDLERHLPEKARRGLMLTVHAKNEGRPHGV